MHWWIREFVWQVTNDISFDVEPVGLRRVVHDQAAAERPAAGRRRMDFWITVYQGGGQREGGGGVTLKA